MQVFICNFVVVDIQAAASKIAEVYTLNLEDIQVSLVEKWLQIEPMQQQDSSDTVSECPSLYSIHFFVIMFF